MRRFLAAAFLVLLAGCGSEPWLPLHVGASWRYDVRERLGSRIETVRVTREIPISGLSGYVLLSGSGESRLVADGGLLKAQALPGMRFDPPIPLLDNSGRKMEWTWQGRLRTLSEWRSASAKIDQEGINTRLGGVRYRALRTRLNLTDQGQAVSVESTFVRGIGLLRQEIRIDDRLQRALEYLSGP